MKKVLIIAVAVIMMLSLFACSKAEQPAAKSPEQSQTSEPSEAPSKNPSEKPGEAKELKLGVLVWKFDDAYGSAVRTAMTKYAEEIGTKIGQKINLEMLDANDSMATQSDQADIMFAAGKDCILVNLADIASGKALVDIAQAKGSTPYLFYNREPQDPAIVKDNKSIFIGTTPREAGDMQGEILAELVAKDPKIDKNGDGKLQYVMFEGEPNNSEAIARTKYSVETAQAKGLELEQLGQTLVCNWDQAKAQDAMAASFANFGKKIEVIFANNDMMALGAIAALNEVGYNTGVADDPKVVVIGVDAVDAALESIKAGKMTATVMQDADAMGKAAITIAVDKALGKDWLESGEYKLAADGYSVRIPYKKITE